MNRLRLYSKVLSAAVLFTLSSLAYALQADIQGVEDSALLNNIDIHLSTLSTPTSCRLSEDIVETISQKVITAAQALGYYQLKVSQIGWQDAQKCQNLTISIEQGQRVKITLVDVKVTGEGQQDERFQALLANLPLKKNNPLDHKLYKQVKGQFDSVALNRGYFDSRFEKSQIQVDVASNTAQIYLHYQSGSRYRFGEIIYPDDLLARDLISEIVPFKVGEAYLASKLGIFNRNLSQTGYFQQVVARPLLEQAKNNQIPIEVVALTKPRDIIDVGGGASTDRGAFATLNWQRPWVNRHGHSLRGNLYVSKPEQSASMNYRIPLEDPLNNYFSVQTGYQAENENDSNSDTLSVSLQRHWAKDTQDWNKIAFLRYTRDQFQQANDPRQTTYLLIPGFTLSRHRSRGGLDITWGDSQLLTIEGASDALVSDINLTRITFETKWLRSIGEHRFLFRAELGALNTNDFSRVPSSLRYFAGGDQSIRGFRYKELAPREPNFIDENGEERKGKLIGGKYLNVASLEYTYPVADNWRVALFTDAGGASDEPFDKIAHSFGFGVSWLSPVGPIRLYFARGQGDFGDENRIHFAMGPVL